MADIEWGEDQSSDDENAKPEQDDFYDEPRQRKTDFFDEYAK